MKKFSFCVLFVLLSSFISATAYADCKPKCANGKICRYDATADEFYCADPPKGSLHKGKSSSKGKPGKGKLGKKVSK